MISKGSNIFTIDVPYRTPLQVSTQMNNFKSTIIIVFGMADPNLSTNFNAKPIDFAQAFPIQYLLKRQKMYNYYSFKLLTINRYTTTLFAERK